MRKIIYRIFFLAMCLICLSKNAVAQDRAIFLSADQISIEQNQQILRARGNVVIRQNDRTLETDLLIYNRLTNQIEIPNGALISDAQGTVLRTSSASLSTDLTQGLISGASLLLAQSFQLRAAQFEQIDERFRVMSRVVGSTCEICELGETPLWQIRASTVVQDQFERRLVFTEPVLYLYGIPVFALPRLSTPDPTVSRASGFLVPSLRQNSLIGVGIDLPYYIVLGDHADATLTPFITTKGNFILGGEYRKNFRNGKIEATGAVAITDQLSNSRYRSFLRADGAFNLARDYELTFGVHVASDRFFKNQYAYGDEDRLRNFVAIEKSIPSRYFRIASSITQSLRPNEIDQNIPIVFPDFFRRDIKNETFLGGKLGVDYQAIGLLREQGQYFKLGAGIDWNKSWTTTAGLQISGHARGQINAYFLKEYTNFSTNTFYGNDSLLSADMTLGAELRYPLSRRTENATQLIEPVVQLVFSPTTLGEAVNEDSTQAEFEETNLFSLNRFPGFDEQEEGFRLNIGVNYLHLANNGWELGATVGRVFRLKDQGQFPNSVSTGLDGENSDFVAAFSLRYTNQFALINRSLFDSDFQVSKNETLFSFAFDKWTGYGSYVWLDQNTILNLNQPQHEISLGADYYWDENWKLTGQWRQNLQTGRGIEGFFGAEFQNECAKMNFSLTLEYDDLGSVTREWGLKLSLEGLGSRSKNKRFKRRCSI